MAKPTTTTSKAPRTPPEEPKPPEGERFTVVIPPELWARVEPLMKKLYLGKTVFTRQAFDLFVIMQDKDPFP